MVDAGVAEGEPAPAGAAGWDGWRFNALGGSLCLPQLLGPCERAGGGWGRRQPPCKFEVWAPAELWCHFQSSLTQGSGPSS